MLTENHIKEGLSRAYIMAVAHRAGFNCSFSATFDYGIDGTLRAVKAVGTRRVESGVAIDFQVKASERCGFESDAIVYDLEAKSQRDLADSSVSLPRVLIVLALPEERERWLEVSEEALLLRRCAFWSSLRGQALTANAKTERIRIPRGQVFDVAALKAMMARVERRGLP
jgi:hypothetical protein